MLKLQSWEARHLCFPKIPPVILKLPPRLEPLTLECLHCQSPPWNLGSGKLIVGRSWAFKSWKIFSISFRLTFGTVQQVEWILETESFRGFCVGRCSGGNYVVKTISSAEGLRGSVFRWMWSKVSVKNSDKSRYQTSGVTAYPETQVIQRN